MVQKKKPKAKESKLGWQNASEAPSMGGRLLDSRPHPTGAAPATNRTSTQVSPHWAKSTAATKT